MRKLFYAGIALIIALSGAAEYATYRISHASNVKQETSIDEIKADLQKPGTIFVLIRGSNQDSKDTDAFFQNAARKLKGKATFLEVDAEKIPEAASEVLPTLVIIDRSMNLFVPLQGSPHKQETMDNTLTSFLQVIAKVKSEQGH